MVYNKGVRILNELASCCCGVVDDYQRYCWLHGSQEEKRRNKVRRIICWLLGSACMYKLGRFGFWFCLFFFWLLERRISGVLGDRSFWVSVSLRSDLSARYM